VDIRVAAAAQRDQVPLLIVAGTAAKCFMVNLKIAHCAAHLASPAISLHDLVAKCLYDVGSSRTRGRFGWSIFFLVRPSKKFFALFNGQKCEESRDWSQEGVQNPHCPDSRLPGSPHRSSPDNIREICLCLTSKPLSRSLAQ
jgi:hypothetical protein